jgi:hypothetical protein
MADIKLSTVVGGTGGLARHMPAASAPFSTFFVKNGFGTRLDSTDGNFFTQISNASGVRGYIGSVITTSIGTTETTIIDVTTSGLLTQVICPGTQSATTIFTVRITIDGTLHTFVSPTVSDNHRFLLGHFPQFSPQIGTGSPGIGGIADYGFTLTNHVMLPTPTQTLMNTNIGIPFDTSLKVTVQASESPDVSVTVRNSAVLYVTPRPLEF